MKRSLALAAVALLFGGCASLRHPHQNPYQKTLFYEQFLNPAAEPLDARIEQTISALRVNPRSAALHNELGQMLRTKGFPKDAEVEFERAVNADARFYPAWYNLGLMRQARGEYVGARFAYARTIHYRKGHAPALFQMGLMEEQRGNVEAAIDYYARAFTFNKTLLDVHVNPRILDSHLIPLALIRMYPKEHDRQSAVFEPTPPTYVQTNVAPQAPSPQAPVTNPAQQPPPAKPPL